MKIFKAISKGVKKTFQELQKPDSFIKGDEFEKYVRDYLFPKEHYKLIHHSHDYDKNKDDYAESSLKPDYEFKVDDVKFHVEVKFRSGSYKGKIEWCKKFQLDRYKALEAEGNKILLALGVGGKPSNPEFIYVVPFSEIKSTRFSQNFLDEYECVPKEIMPPSDILDDLGFSTSYCIRCKTDILFNIDTPYCKKCFTSWKKFKNKNYKEKYCHDCGKSNQSDMEKPICYTCYKANS